MRTNRTYKLLAGVLFGMFVGAFGTYFYVKEKQYVASSELLVREASNVLGSLQGMLKRRQPNGAEASGSEFAYWLQLEVMSINAFLNYTAGAKALHERGLALPYGSMLPAKVAEFPEFVGEFKLLNDRLVNFVPKRERLGRYLGVEVNRSEELMAWLVSHADEIRVTTTRP